MLEQLRRNSRSFIIWVLFIIIIAAFALTFGSQGGLEMSCQGDSSYAMSVDEEEVPTASLRFAMNTLTGPRAQRAQQALDMILMREILAQAGEEAGFKTDYKTAAAYLRRGEIFLFGNPQEKVFFDDDEQFFDYERMRMIVEGWGISVDQFIAEQERELLAYAMRGLITESAGASSDEARARFEHENTTATIEAVKFRPSSYRTKLELTEARIQAYLAGHEAEVREKYEQDKRLYQGVGEQVKIRQIVFKRAAPAAGEPSGEAPAAAAPAEAPAAEAPAAPPAEDPGLVAAKRAHEKLVQGMDFAALAAERSEDERSKAKGGDLGWRPRKTPGMGAKELGDALHALEPGQISEVIETPNGFYILKVEGKRDGDLSFDQVKTEIAERLAGQYYARELARRAANQALAEAKAGKMLSDLFEQQARTPGIDPSQLPPELLQQFTPEQLQQLLQPQGGEEGRLQLESRDIPASALWQGAEPGAAADQPAPAAPVAADKPAVVAQPADSAGSAAPAPEPTPTADIDIDIPADVAKPKLVKIGPFTRDRDGSIAQLGKSKELMSTIFDQLKIGQLAPEVYEVDGDFVLVQMVERKNPNLDELDAKKQEELMHDIARERGYLLLSSWLKERCTKLRDAGDIKVNQSLLTALAESPDQPILYTPCSAFP